MGIVLTPVRSRCGGLPLEHPVFRLALSLSRIQDSEPASLLPALPQFCAFPGSRALFLMRLPSSSAVWPPLFQQVHEPNFVRSLGLFAMGFTR